MLDQRCPVLTSRDRRTLALETFQEARHGTQIAGAQELVDRGGELCAGTFQPVPVLLQRLQLLCLPRAPAPVVLQAAQNRLQIFGLRQSSQLLLPLAQKLLLPPLQRRPFIRPTVDRALRKARQHL